jgi:hypothetical protein
MSDIDYKKELRRGICEVVWMDSQTVEYTNSMTTSPNHVTENEPDCPIEDDSEHAIVAWNMNTEEWQRILTYQIVNFERLTGAGIKDSDELGLDVNAFDFMSGGTQDDEVEPNESDFK